MSNKECKYQGGVKISEELSSEDKEFINSMKEWKETILIQMLTEKILVLN